MGITLGVELIWYKTIANGLYNSNLIPVVYIYGGFSINIIGENIWNIKVLINFIKDETLRAFGSARQTAWKVGGGLSICAFLLFGSFTHPNEYSGPFITSGLTIWHVKTYFSISKDGKLRAYGLGISSSKFGFSPISSSYYLMIPTVIIQSIANDFSALLNKVKMISTRI